jgi:HAD superfamily hydrolase (TIGR01450 family)
VKSAATIVCDLDGVIWLGGEPIAGSVAAVERLREAGHRVVFVTNSSAFTIAEHTASLAAIGIEAAGNVLSSASAAGELISAGERVLACGGTGVVEAIELAGATAIAGDDAEGAAAGVDAVIVGLHRTFDYHRLTLAVVAVRAGARLIATNRDPLYPTPTGPIPGGGSIVAAVATASGADPVTAGKPFPPMARALHALLGDGVAPEDLVVVGDQVSTDGRFATELGCRFALVRSGNTPPDAAVEFDRAYDGANFAAVVESIVTART